MSQQKLKLPFPLLLLFAVYCFKVFGDGNTPNCPLGHNQGTELAFRETPGNFTIVCDKTFVELTCCIKGYTSIKWYRKRLGTWEEIKWNPKKHSDMFCPKNDRNQTLILKKVLSHRDNITYMCMAENGTGQQLINTIFLEIRDCNTPKAPEILLPIVKVMHRPLHSDVNITCKGFFGNVKEVYGMLLWFRQRPGNLTRWIPSTNWNPSTDPNTNVTTSEDESSMTATVQISNITEDNYGNYTCQLFSSIEYKAWTVELKKKVTAEQVADGWKYGLICIMTILALLVLAALLLHCFLLDIKLFYRDRFAKADDDVSGKKFDALVVCNNNDKNDRDFVVEKLYKVLEEQYGYKLFIEERNALGGVLEANAWLMRANSSRCIIFVMSPALLEEQWVDYVYFSTAKEIETPKIFIIHQPVQDSDWKNYQVAFKKTFQMAKRKIKWPQDKLSKTGNGTLKDKSAPSTLTGKISKSDNLSLRADTSLNDKLSATDKSPSSPMIMNNHNSSSSNSPKKSKEESCKRQHISRQEDKFWKKIRLALPKPMSGSNNITFYKSQDSVSSLTPTTSPKLSSALDASHV